MTASNQYITTSDRLASDWAMRMAYNHCHVLTVANDWDARGRPFYAVLMGQALNEGFPLGSFKRRIDAVAAVLAAVKALPEGQPCIAAYPHGTAWRWLDVKAYRRHGVATFKA